VLRFDLTRRCGAGRHSESRTRRRLIFAFYVWQNCSSPGTRNYRVPKAKVEHLEAAGLRIGAPLDRAVSSPAPARAAANSLRCRQKNLACKSNPSSTGPCRGKIAPLAKRALTLGQPIPLHITGCHHYCDAAHYIGDIGLIRRGSVCAGRSRAITVRCYPSWCGGGAFELTEREGRENLVASQ